MIQKYTQYKRYVTILLVLFFLGANGQVLQWSNPTKLKGTAVFTKVVGENQSGIFLLRYRNRFYSKNIILERYNHLLVLEKSKMIGLKNSRLVKIYMTNDSILIVKAKYNKSAQQNDLIAQWYDFDIEPMGNDILLASAPVKELGDKGNFRLRISDDLKSISLLHSRENLKTREIVLHHTLFNIKLEPIHTKVVQLPYNYKEFIVQDFLVTNRQDIMLLCQTFKKEKKKNTLRTLRIFHLKDSTLQDYLVSDTLSLKSSKLVYDRSNDEGVMVAFYGDKYGTGIIGTLFLRLNLQESNTTVTLGPFDEKFFEDINVNNQTNMSISEGFEIVQSIPRSDGGMILIAEQKEIATEDDIIFVNGIPQSTSKNIYNYNELLIINYDNEAFLDWQRVIAKNQTTVNDGGYYSSIATFIGDKYIQILYNDQLRNSGDVMQYTLYNNGTMKSTKLLKSELEFVAIIPLESKQVSSNKLILPTTKNRRFALLKLVYN